MAWRTNALHKSPMTQLGMNWELSIGPLVIILPTLWTVSAMTAGAPVQGRDQETMAQVVEAEGGKSEGVARFSTE